MKIAFYLENRRIPGADLRKPGLGNPGVGGTQYLFVALPFYMQRLRPKAWELVLLANVTNNLPPELNSVQVDSLADAALVADGLGCDIFIFRPTSDPEGMQIFNILSQTSLKAIAWAHNTPSPQCLDAIANHRQIPRFVAVGREQLDELRDHAVFGKALWIFNGFDVAPYLPPPNLVKEYSTVVYLGSLVPDKGFHLLARAWPAVIAQYPDAKLVVIGTGRLYDSNTRLGKWQVATEEYERQFRKYLSDSFGNPHPSVHFAGLLKHEKIAILQEATVGVVNPSGKSENCPGSALEFQACGTPVVSRAYRGLLDTVVHGKTGLLGRTQKDLVHNLLTLLRDRDKAYTFGQNGIQFVADNFNYDRIVGEWHSLLEDVMKSVPVYPRPVEQNLFHNYKFIREGLRIFKQAFPPARAIPSLYSCKQYAKIWINRR